MRHDGGWTRRVTAIAGGRQPLVVAEDLRLQVAQLRAGLDAELVDEPFPGRPVRRQRIGLAADAVQRRHQQRPERFAKRVRRRELGQRPDDGGRIAFDTTFEVDLQRAQPPLDQRVH